MKKALICGITGQDGSYLAQWLLNHGYEVYGTSRDAQVSGFINLVRLGIRDHVLLYSMSLNDFRSVLQVLSKVEPDEVYNLAGQTSVGLSFEQPVETMESISLGTLNLLESIRFINPKIKLYNASSSECFGNTSQAPANEQTPFHPRSPYAVAKSAAYWQVVNYREAYGLYACSGILFNHESPLRPKRFVTQKIVQVACNIAKGSMEKLRLGNLKIERDWGWAPEYIQAMHLMLQQPEPDDYVIATGKSHTLEQFIAYVFEHLGLDWYQHVVSDPSLFRPTDIAYSCGNPAKAETKLKWKAQVSLKEIAEQMVDSVMRTFDQR